MNIYTSSFETAEAATDTPLTHARIGYQSWLRDLTASDVTVSSETANGPGDAPLRPDTAEFWEPSELPATWEVDLGATRPVDYVGVVGNLGSSNCAVMVEWSDGALVGSPQDLVWTQFSDDAQPSDDSPLLFLGASVNARLLRLTFSAIGSPADAATPPRVAVIYAGEVLKMQRPIFGGHGPINLSRQTVLHGSMSAGGQFLGQGFRRHGVSGSVAFRHLEDTWVRETLDPFIRAARQYPYFFAWRPGQYVNDVAYVWTQEDIRPSNMGVRSYMQVGWPMQGIGHE